MLRQQYLNIKAINDGTVAINKQSDRPVDDKTNDSYEFMVDLGTKLNRKDPF